MPTGDPGWVSGPASEWLIDLGDVGHPDGHPHGRRGDELDWSAPPPGAAGRRQWPIVVVLCLVVLFATGSRPASTVEDLGVLAEHTIGFVADRTTLYALRDDPALSAYDWRTGQIWWSRSIPPDSGQVYLAADRAYVRHRACTTAVGWSLE